MTHKELPQLTPAEDLGADGIGRLNIFLSNLKDAPDIMHAVMQLHPTDAQFTQRVLDVRRAGLATPAALAMTSVAEILDSREDDLIYPANETTRKSMEAGIKSALAAAEEGRLSARARGLARFSGVIKAYVEACPPDEPVDIDEVKKQLGMEVPQTDQPAVTVEVPQQRTKSSRSVSLAA